MSDAITRFFNRPTFNGLPQEYGGKTAFLLESRHAPAAWKVLMTSGPQVKYSADYLFSRTPFEPYQAQGPTWFVVNEVCVAGLADICHQRPAGIALSCADPVKALAHARTLLSMTPPNVLGIHNPAAWAALAMEYRGDQACLFGAWSEVYSPVPSANPSARVWHAWTSETPATDACQYPLALPNSLYSTYKDLRWVHWLRRNPLHFAEVPDTELPRVVANLNVLVEHGIGRDCDLLPLSALVIEGDLREREDLLPILTSSERRHRRVEQLLQGLQP